MSVILGKNALDDASLFTGGSSGVTLHAPLIVEGSISSEGGGEDTFESLSVTGTLDVDGASTLAVASVSGTLGVTGISTLANNLVFSALGKGITLKVGANAKAGTFTANGVTPVAVATTAFVAGSTVAISLKTVGGTVGAQPHLETATAGTGFTVVATASDTSVYNWAIIDQA